MGIYIPNITLKDIKEHPSRFLIGSKGVTLEVTDVYGNALSENAVQEIAPHGRLIDADAFAKTLKDISIRQGYDKLTFDKSLTVDDVLDSVIVELNASGLDGSKNAPTVIEAEDEHEP